MQCEGHCHAAWMTCLTRVWRGEYESLYTPRRVSRPTARVCVQWQCFLCWRAALAVVRFATVVSVNASCLVLCFGHVTPSLRISLWRWSFNVGGRVGSRFFARRTLPMQTCRCRCDVDDRLMSIDMQPLQPTTNARWWWRPLNTCC